MSLRYHQNMPRVHGKNVHESENSLIRVHNTGWSRPRDYLTEHTIFQLVPSQRQRQRINMNFHARRHRKAERARNGFTVDFKERVALSFWAHHISSLNNHGRVRS
jgi:hypothetical protein